MVLTVAFDYGSRVEIARAAQRAQIKRPGKEINADAIDAELYAPELPPVDVLVRTSGETRISNFLLWQAANARVYFTDCSWPDFSATQLDEALALLTATR
jgi:undecaprenyl diphosphate synthase